MVVVDIVVVIPVMDINAIKTPYVKEDLHERVVMRVHVVLPLVIILLRIVTPLVIEIVLHQVVHIVV